MSHRHGLEAAVRHALEGVYLADETRRNHARCMARAPTEAREKLARALLGQPAAERHESEWPADPDLPGAPEPVSFPLHALPGVLREHVSSVANAVQIPHDVPALLALAAVSAAIGGKLEVRVNDSWVREPVCIYTMAILPPATRKSATFGHLVDPLEEWHLQEEARDGVARRAAEDLVAAREKSLDRAIAELARGRGSEEAVRDARSRLEDARRAIPPGRRILAQDATSEAIVRLMAENGGSIALMAPEGDLLRIADGRYDRSGGARLQELKQAWSGEALRTDRIGRSSLHIPRPSLTLALTLQPGVLQSLKNSGSFRGEGVFGRFLFVLPNPRVGWRRTHDEVPPLDVHAASAYATALHRILDAEPAGASSAPSTTPAVLRFEPAAGRLLHSFAAEVERMLRPEGELGSLQDWGGKATGQAVRLAAILEIAARAGDGRPLFQAPIGRWAVESSIEIVHALRTHALAVLSELGAASEVRLARYVWKRITNLPHGSTERDVHKATRGKKELSRMEDLRPILADLAQRGLIRSIQPPSPGPGRPPSPVIEVHPAYAGTMHTIHKNRELGPEEGDSVHSVHPRDGTDWASSSEWAPALEVPGLLDESVDP